ncbi:hypothetical protein [Halohasta salina]|uniref:hypothetical protein n=1 Tax=Halohasta salina TaxID=2961621 RepID=UPI0020A4BFEF|nr:hypothetical protein [Halohasta salina]
MRFDDAYFGLLGVAVGLAGLLAVARGVGLAIPDPQSTLAVVSVSGTFLLWRGIVLLSAGVFYFQGATEGLANPAMQARVFMASVMVWIVAGADLLGRLLGAVPGDSEVWVAGSGEVLAAMGPPYSPAVLAAPFALAALAYRSREGSP